MKHTRGESVTFQVNFFEDDALTIPRVPLNNAQPTYDLLDPTGSEVASGVATPVVGQPGKYEVDWAIPDDAPLSRDESPWRIQLTLTDLNHNSFEELREFEVLPYQPTQNLEKDKGYLVIEGKKGYIHNRRTRRPHSITVEVFNAISSVAIETESLTPTEVVDGETYVYRDSIAADAAGFVVNTNFIAIWEIQETVADIPRHETELIYIISKKVLIYMHHLNMMINKLCRDHTVEFDAWTPFEQYNALNYGLKIINSTHPNNVEYSVESVPSALGHYLIMAAAIWALQSAYMEQGMLHFNFSGQSVSLDFDHRDWIESSISRFQGVIDQGLSRDKLGYARRSSSRGSLGVRPRDWRAQNVIIAKIDNFSSNTWIRQLVGLGVI